MPLAPACPLRTALAAGAVLVLLSLAGCSGAGGSYPVPVSAVAAPAAFAAASADPWLSPAAAAITITGFTFSPADLTVAPGSAITVTNQDDTTHTLTATDATSFDTGAIDPGDSVTFTAPMTEGSYPFACTNHPYMTGTLTVRQS